MNKNPKMKNASENLSQILNPKVPKHKQIEVEVIRRIFQDDY